MITRREFLVALGAGVIAAPLVSLAQQAAKKVYRIGYLSPRAGELRDEVFLKGLRELGYIEGENLVIEWRFAKGNSDLLPSLAAELVRLKVDCIVANGTTSTRAAKQATNTIPIVMGNSDADPVQQGLVANLARPGGNITGFTNISSDLFGKRLELLKETLPKLSRVAILLDPNSQAAAGYIREAKITAPALGLQLQFLEVRRPEDLESAFRAASNEHAQALLVVTSGIIPNHRGQIANLAVKARLPTMFSGSVWVVGGGLISYGVDTDKQYRRVATYVDKILKGAKPTDLPVEQPTIFELVVNLKTAKALGITIPQSILVRADKVIE